uniref:Uncharacterized protein n=1 Tax=Piliocolobus tephrosceles TaxID=591936 RepID=A0A8C9I3J2_9PRIM
RRRGRAGWVAPGWAGGAPSASRTSGLRALLGLRLLVAGSRLLQSKARPAPAAWDPAGGDHSGELGWPLGLSGHGEPSGEVPEPGGSPGCGPIAV